MVSIAVFILSCGLIFTLFGIIRVLFFWKDHQVKNVKNWPAVAVLVTARNEADFLPRLLNSFDQLDYPEACLKFYLYDDQSNDDTGKILDEWCSRANGRIKIETGESNQDFSGKNGKALALARLCKVAQEEFLFFTDADCTVNPEWIREGVSCFSSNTGMVIGVTKVKDSSLFGKFQELEWWNTLIHVKIAADLSFQTTGLGNNMVIRKAAYDQSGGFEQTIFSLTEDLEISRLIHQAGYAISHQFSSKMLANTKSEPDLGSLLVQRKRWFTGVVTLPWAWLILLNFHFLYVPALLLVCVTYPILGILFLVSKLTFQSILFRLAVSRVGQKLNWPEFLFFDFYSFLINGLTILYYFYPSKIRWKSRSYS